MHLPSALSLLSLSTIALSLHLPRRLTSPALKDTTILSSSLLPCSSCPSSLCSKCLLGHNNTFLASAQSSPSSSSLDTNANNDLYHAAPAAFVDPAANTQAVSLIGFQLSVPANDIHSCSAIFPAFTKLPKQNLTILFEQVPASAAGWDEDSIDAENAPPRGPLISRLEVPALSNMPRVDLTSACRGARADGQFSVYVSAEQGSFEIWSKDSGNPAILRVQEYV